MITLHNLTDGELKFLQALSDLAHDVERDNQADEADALPETALAMSERVAGCFREGKREYEIHNFTEVSLLVKYFDLLCSIAEEDPEDFEEKVSGWSMEDTRRFRCLIESLSSIEAELKLDF